MTDIRGTVGYADHNKVVPVPLMPFPLSARSVSGGRQGKFFASFMNINGRENKPIFKCNFCSKLQQLAKALCNPP